MALFHNSHLNSSFRYLMDLPPELRIQIFRDFVVDTLYGGKWNIRVPCENWALPIQSQVMCLLRVSKQTYNEAVDQVYAHVTINLEPQEYYRPHHHEKTVRRIQDFLAKVHSEQLYGTRIEVKLRISQCDDVFNRIVVNSLRDLLEDGWLKSLDVFLSGFDRTLDEKTVALRTKILLHGGRREDYEVTAPFMMALPPFKRLLQLLRDPNLREGSLRAHADPQCESFGGLSGQLINVRKDGRLYQCLKGMQALDRPVPSWEFLELDVDMIQEVLDGVGIGSRGRLTEVQCRLLGIV